MAEIEVGDNLGWVMVAACTAAVIIVFVMVMTGYYRTVETSAINKGLCQATAPGSNQIIWTTCPVSK